MEREIRPVRRRRLLALVAVPVAIAAVWAGVAAGGNSGASDKTKAGGAKVTHVKKQTRAQTRNVRTHEDCPFSHGASAPAV